MTTLTRRALLAAGSATALSTTLSMPAIAQQRTLTVGDTAPLPFSWPLLIANRKNFYADEGLKVETVYSGNNAASTQQLIGGSLDLVVPTYETAIRAMSGGAPIQIVAALMLAFPYVVISKPDVKTAADLKGKRVMLTLPKSILTVFWRRWVKEQGIDPDSIDYVYDPATPTRFAALESGTVQAAVLSQPFDWRAEERGNRKFFDLARAAKGYGFTGVAARKDWLGKNGDTMKAYLRATSRGVKFLYDPANRDEAVSILAQDAKLDRALAMRTHDYYLNDLRPFDPSLDVPEKQVRLLLDILKEIGDVRGLEDNPAKYVTRDYLPQA